MSEGELSKRVRYLKKEEGGQKIMCEIMERIREEGRAEGREEGRAEGREEGRKEERENTRRERARADAEMRKVQELEKKIMQLQLQIAGGK